MKPADPVERTGRPRWFAGTLRDWLIIALVAALVFGLLALLADMANVAQPGFFLTGVVVTVLVYALFAQGLNIQFGFAGLINFGHVAFFALGAYGVALFSQRHPACRDVPGTSFPGWLDWACGDSGHLVWVATPGAGSFWTLALGIFIGFLAAGIFALILGVPTLKLREDYLAIVTIGAAEIMRITFTNESWMAGGNPTNTIGGATGVPRYPKPWADAVANSEFFQSWAAAWSTTPYYIVNILITLALLALVMTIFGILVNSPWGRVLKAIREDEDVARALGKNVFRYKIQALVLGALAGALAGVAWAWYVSPVNPEVALPILTFYAWIIMIIGGAGNLRGPIVGSLIFAGIFQSTRLLPIALPANIGTLPGISHITSPAGRVMLVGLLLIFTMMYRPQGILGKREEMLLAK